MGDGDVAGQDGDLVQGQLPGLQRHSCVGELGASPGDGDDVGRVGMGQAGADDEVVLG
nr:hypothetical protein [Phycicoccus sp. Root101]